MPELTWTDNIGVYKEGSVSVSFLVGEAFGQTNNENEMDHDKCDSACDSMSPRFQVGPSTNVRLSTLPEDRLLRVPGLFPSTLVL
jgi:hypothetical protein